MSNRLAMALLGALLATSPLAVGCDDEDDARNPGTVAEAGTAGVGGASGGESGSGASSGTKGDAAGRAAESGHSGNDTEPGAAGAPAVEGGSGGGGAGPGAGSGADASVAGFGGELIEPQGGSTGSRADGGAGGQGEEEPALGAERWLAFRVQKQNDYTHALFVAPVPALAPPILIAPDADAFRWSSDGTRLLYMTPASGPQQNAAYVVRVSSEGVGEPEMIHLPLPGSEDRVLNASLSPDGSTLALQRYEDGQSHWYLRSIADGPDAWNPIGLGVPGEYVSEPGRRFSWSPDGQRFALVEPEGGIYDQLTVVDSSGAGESVSFQDLALLEWSSDGTHILADGLYFEPLGTRALFWIDAETVYGVDTLTEPGVQNDFSLAQIAPDTSAVLFKAEQAGEYDLFLKAFGSNDPPVKLDGVLVQNAIWLGNSRALLYWGYAPDEVLGPHLYAVPKDDVVFTRLNPDESYASCFSGQCIRWSGNTVVFTTSDVDQSTYQLHDATFEGATPTVRRITHFPQQTSVDGFDLAPDPSRVLVFVTTPDGREVRYLDRGGEIPFERLVASYPYEGSPFSYGQEGPPFTADSKYFYYAANDDLDPDGMVDLFVSEVVDGTPTPPAKLTYHGPNEQLYGVAWQP